MIDISGILAAIESKASQTGLFEAVNGNEPFNPPATGGLTCAVWVNHIGPVPAGSGLTATTGRIEFNVRIYTSAVQQPLDAIDPQMVAAVDALLSAYSDDFQLGGEVRDIDLFGAHGTPLQAAAGYLQMAGTTYRVYTITLPVIVNDLWAQAV
jgi:hypothetical protein